MNGIQSARSPGGDESRGSGEALPPPSRPARLVHLVNLAAMTTPSIPASNEEPARDSDLTTLRRAGMTVEIVPTTGLPWNPAARLAAAWRALDPCRALWTLLCRRRATLICAHMDSALLVLLLRRVFCFGPAVLVWEVDWSPGWWMRDLVGRLVLRRTDFAVVFSTNQVPEIRRLGAGRVQCFHVPFGVDFDFFRPKTAQPRVAGYVFSCGSDAGRDFASLVRASAGLEVRCLIRTPHRIDAERVPNVRWLRERVSYDRLRDLYDQALVVVVCTHETINACGLTTLLEAMAMARPVVVTDNPALRDYLPPPGAGIVVPVGDSAALREAIESLLRDPARACAMGLRGRAFASARFSLHHHYEAMREVVQAAIAARRTGTITSATGRGD